MSNQAQCTNLWQCHSGSICLGGECEQSGNGQRHPGWHGIDVQPEREPADHYDQTCIKNRCH